jgi:hypothetical protein
VEHEGEPEPTVDQMIDFYLAAMGRTMILDFPLKGRRDETPDNIAEFAEPCACDNSAY